MKIITEPTVKIVSVPFYMEIPECELPEENDFINESTDSEKLITTAGKICYDSYGKDGRSIKEHISNLTSSEHYSVLEHANVSLYIAGISRACSHELVRHRHFSYSQRSTRYVKEEDASIVLEPFLYELGVEHQLVQNFLTSTNIAFVSYRELVKDLMSYPTNHENTREKRKWARGKARNILPHCLETRLIMTGNLRSWRELIEKRTNRGAEAEIRRLAVCIYNKLLPIAPLVFEDAKISPLIDGFSEISFSKARKV